MTSLIGIGGAVLATLLGQALGWYAHGDRAGFLASVGGAVVVLIVYEALKPRTVIFWRGSGGRLHTSRKSEHEHRGRGEPRVAAFSVDRSARWGRRSQQHDGGSAWESNLGEALISTSTCPRLAQLGSDAFRVVGGDSEWSGSRVAAALPGDRELDVFTVPVFACVHSESLVCVRNPLHWQHLGAYLCAYADVPQVNGLTVAHPRDTVRTR